MNILSILSFLFIIFYLFFSHFSRALINGYKIIVQRMNNELFTTVCVYMYTL